VAIFRLCHSDSGCNSDSSKGEFVSRWACCHC
jgi:hypothetical protein